MRDKNDITLVFVTDSNYLQHLAVCLVSILENTEYKEYITLYIIHDGVIQKDRERLENTISKYHLMPYWIEVDKENFRDLKIVRYYSLAPYYKVAIPELLPPTCERALYVDCDMVFEGDIIELWETDLKDAVIGAAADPLALFQTDNLGYEKFYGYFNSGLMLMDIKKMKKACVADEIFAFLRANKEKIVFVDQDGFNGVLYGKWKQISYKWNYLNRYFNQSKMERLFSTDEGLKQELKKIKKGKEDLKGIHYTSEYKPWHYMSRHPLKHRYYHYLKLTEWKNFVPADRTVINIIKKHSLYNESLWRFMSKNIVYNDAIRVKLKRVLPNRIRETLLAMHEKNEG